jgi:hypothetical protein
LLGDDRHPWTRDVTGDGTFPELGSREPRKPTEKKRRKSKELKASRLDRTRVPLLMYATDQVIFTESGSCLSQHVLFAFPQPRDLSRTGNTVLTVFV